MSIVVISDNPIKVNNLFQKLHWQIEAGGFQGKGEERWINDVPMLDDQGNQMTAENGSPMYSTRQGKYFHSPIVQLVYASTEEKARSKAKGPITFIQDDFIPEKDFIKNLMQDKIEA